MRSKAGRYKTFVLHRPDNQRLNETFVTQAQVRVEGIPDLPRRPSPPRPHPTGQRAGEGAGQAFSMSQVELGTAQTRLVGGKREEACPRWAWSFWG